MNHQQIIQQTRRLYDEIYTQGKYEVCSDIISDKITIYDLSRNAKFEGLAAFKEIEKSYHKAFPNKREIIDEIFAATDRVIVRWSSQGTHTGDLEGLPATHRQFKISGISIFGFANGKIVAIWQSWDRLSLLEQLGEVEALQALH